MLKRSALFSVIVAVVWGLGCGGGGGGGSSNDPKITSFTAARSPITSGDATTLTATFTNGTGSVDGGVGAVESGVAKSTGALTADTVFTLTVTGGGTSVTKTVSVAVAPLPQQPVITAPSIVSTGIARSASVAAQTGMTFQWTVTGGTFAGGATTATGQTVSFTPGSGSSLQLSCTATNAAGATSAAGTADASVVPAPAISSFTAAKTSLTSGTSTTLTATFTGGTGSVDQTIGAVTSGVAKSTGAITFDTTYTLTVTNTAGDSVTQQVTITVVGPPNIVSFTADKTTITTGTATMLTANFSGGTGSVDNSIGAVTSSVAVSTGNLTTTTTFTLTVTNGVGTSVTAEVTVTVVAAPAITAFSAAKSPITSGTATTLTATFTGGDGSVDQSIGAVTSGVAKSTGNLTADTTFTLTVTNAANDSVTQQVTVAVVAAPAIASFVASPTTVLPGQSSTLTATFSGGDGSIDNSIGAVTSGAGVSTGALSASTTYTLTVTNSAGDSKTATATVTVRSCILFTTEGQTFAPIIAVSGTPDINWYWTDGSSQAGTIDAGKSTITKDFGSAGTNKTCLSVNPWSAVTGINLGYDPSNAVGAGAIVDGIDLLDAQQVSNVAGLSVVAPYLEKWSSDSTPTADPAVWNYNTIPSLDFTSFASLVTIEAHQAGLAIAGRQDALQTLTLPNPSVLLRVDIDSASNLTTLDLSSSSALQFLGAAYTTGLTDVIYPSSLPDAWHIVLRDCQTVSESNLYQTAGTLFPDIAELDVEGCNQGGAFSLSSTSLTRAVEIALSGNGYTSLSLAGALTNTAATGAVYANRNQLTSVDVSGAVQLTILDLRDNHLDQAAVDGVLTTLDGFASSPSGTLKVQLENTIFDPGNACPSATGLTAAANLTGKGWTVSYASCP